MKRKKYEVYGELHSYITYRSRSSVSIGRWQWRSLANDNLLEVSQLVLLVVVGEHIEDFFSGLWLEVTMVMEALSADATGEV